MFDRPSGLALFLVTLGGSVLLSAFPWFVLDVRFAFVFALWAPVLWPFLLRRRRAY